MKNFSQDIFQERCRISEDTKFFAEWELRWAPEQIQRETELREKKDPEEPHQPDVLEMGQETPLLCCPEDHRCPKSCKAAKTLCRYCELPVCLECQMCLQQKQLSPRWKHCARKRWMCKRYRIDLNLEIHRPVKVLFLTRNQVCLTSKSLPDLDMNLKPSTTGRYWLNTASRPTSVTPASPNHSPPISLEVCSFNVPKMTTKRPSG